MTLFGDSTIFSPEFKLPVKIKYHEPIDKLVKYDNGDWIDLRVGHEVTIKAGEYCKISLGVSIQVPKGYELIIKPRSSTFDKWGIIQVCSGIIDESFCGDNDVITFGVLATRDVTIPFNTRICQFRLFKHMPDIKFDEVDTLGNPDRGGYGSTGEV